MQREVISIKIERQKRRAQFLFNDGEFRPRKEKSIKNFSRQVKHRSRVLQEMLNF